MYWGPLNKRGTSNIPDPNTFVSLVSSRRLCTERSWFSSYTNCDICLLNFNSLHFCSKNFTFKLFFLRRGVKENIRYSILNAFNLVFC